MKMHATALTLMSIIVTGMPFLDEMPSQTGFDAMSPAYAAPKPIDAGTAHAIAVNDNLACSSGSCNTTVSRSRICIIQGIITYICLQAEAGTQSSTPSTLDSTSPALSQFDTFLPLSFLTFGGLALSTGML